MEFSMRYGNPSKKSKIIASTKGHAIEFPGKGTTDKDKVPAEAILATDGILYVRVPDAIAEEVASAGMLPESEIEEPADGPKLPKRPEDPSIVQKEVFAAFDLVIEANERESFSGTGLPKPAAMEKILGYSLNNAEIKDLFGRYLSSKKE
jgi:hypothetical protein